MVGELLRIAGQCDGLRCDMLVLPEVFERTWGRRAPLLMGATRFDREPGDLDARGLYLDMPAWGYHVFEITPSAVAHADESVLATQGA